MIENARTEDNMKINIFWFRRDLRLDDNNALNHALAEGFPVLALFIFDTAIIDELPADDPRISFIYETLSGINNQLLKSGSSLLILKGDPETVWRNLVETYDLNAVFINKDYEPYSISRDLKVESILRQKSVNLFRFKDQVIFEEKEIVKSDNKPYTLFTPYKNRWIQKFKDNGKQKLPFIETTKQNYFRNIFPFPSKEELGFNKELTKGQAF